MYAAIYALGKIDELAVVFFSVEYVVRFICSPRKWFFFKDSMNMVDFAAIVPFYLTLALDSMEDMQG
jgi:potassium voltage-gated channel Shab-related subfamily B protein 1